MARPDERREEEGTKAPGAARGWQARMTRTYRIGLNWDQLAFWSFADNRCLLERGETLTCIPTATHLDGLGDAQGRRKLSTVSVLAANWRDRDELGRAQRKWMSDQSKAWVIQCRPGEVKRLCLLVEFAVEDNEKSFSWCLVGSSR